MSPVHTRHAQRLRLHPQSSSHTSPPLTRDGSHPRALATIRREVLGPRWFPHGVCLYEVGCVTVCERRRVIGNASDGTAHWIDFEV